MLTESMEDYLEMIYRLIKEKGSVRAVELSEALHLQASSVTKMIQKLDENGFINYEKYRNISLTQSGCSYGEFLAWRDQTLKIFLQLLTTQKDIDEQVEGMEHYITPRTMDLVTSLIQYFQAHPGELEQLNALQQKTVGPTKSPLPLLRAWEFRHSLPEDP